MTLKVLLSASVSACDKFSGPLKDAFAKAALRVELSDDHPPETVDYIVYAPNPKLMDFSAYTRTKAVLSLWAGVESIVSNPTLTQPLTRMVDSGLREGMTEWVCAHVLRYHIGIDSHIVNPDRTWINDAPPLARNRRVTILGLGDLGQACATALAVLNFDVCGWSRRQKSIDRITCLSGETGLQDALGRADILVLLLPLTDQTQDLMNATRLSLLPTGARIINPGRGQLIDDKALLNALEAGQITHATLDVFRTEPLPQSHPFWDHPNVTVTPHIASDTRANTAALVIANNIKRSESGSSLLYLVDRQSGY